MKRKQVALIGILILLIGAVYWNNQRLSARLEPQINQVSQPVEMAPTGECIPTFADGGGPFYQPNAPFRENIAPVDHAGQKLIVEGRVLSQDCVTVLPGIVLDIWQANETGNYQDEWYRGKVTSDPDGRYRFETVIPKGYGEGTGYRPPHIHFKAYQADLEIITSQMFLPAARAQRIEEAYIMELEKGEAEGEEVYFGFHDIILPM